VYARAGIKRQAYGRPLLAGRAALAARRTRLPRTGSSCGTSRRACVDCRETVRGREGGVKFVVVRAAAVSTVGPEQLMSVTSQAERCVMPRPRAFRR